MLGVDFDPKNPSSQEPHPVLFDQINGTLICSIVQKMDGAAGPPGLTPLVGRDYAQRLETTQLAYVMY